MRAVDFPIGTLAVCREDERTFGGANENADFAHKFDDSRFRLSESTTNENADFGHPCLISRKFVPGRKP
jgi:hypothetical protein